MTYSDLTTYFGTGLSDAAFQAFLNSMSCDPATYNVADSDYITCESKGLEIGFRNDEAVYDEDEGTVFEKGKPVFSHFNLYPAAGGLISALPFGIGFSDNRNTVKQKAGEPVKSTDLDDPIFQKRFMIDHYELGNLAISIDYNPEDETIELIQIRDNGQAKAFI